MTSTSAQAVLDSVALSVARLPRVGASVAIDGPDGAGQTHFADHLAETLRTHYQRQVVRISVDDFHNPRAVRYRQGRQSPQGFWEDSYNYARFRRDVLEPFAPTGSRVYRCACHNVATDEDLRPEDEFADPAAVLLVDGIFLHRHELIAEWDLTVFLDVDFMETAKRMARRDGTPADPEHPQMNRYIEGQRLYFRQCRPHGQATILIDNNDVAQPRIASRAPGGQ
jgi:uridine kinase